MLAPVLSWWWAPCKKDKWQTIYYYLFMLKTLQTPILKKWSVMSWVFLAALKLTNHCSDSSAADWRAAGHLRDQWLHGVWVLGQTFTSSIDWQLTDMTVTTGAIALSVTSFTMTSPLCHLLPAHTQICRQIFIFNGLALSICCSYFWVI